MGFLFEEMFCFAKMTDTDISLKGG
jgi:hypothetical protein